MFNNQSRPTVTNCSFISNVAGGDGGGMYNALSSPTVTNCTFSGNILGSGDGGGMYNEISSPTVTNCTFRDNTSTGYGGGMANLQSSPAVTNCTFSGNSASINGGGMYNTQNSSPTVTNCAFTGNTASSDTYGGGGMFNNVSSNPNVTNCTFSNNRASGKGGGMDNYNNSNPTVINCILWGDTPDEIYDDSTSSTTITYSNVQDGWPGPPPPPGNIDADPLFVDAAGGDLRLSSSVSPCVDAGDNSAAGLPATDLAGNPRIVDGDWNGTATVDMGAYEFQSWLIHNITQDSWYETIQAAIGAAINGDEIEVAPGTYNEAINFNGKAVRLYSSGGPDVTIIDGTGNYHVVQCVNGEGADTILEGFTITGGNANGPDANSWCGAGMFNFTSSPKVTNCTFSGNKARNGGGMCNDQGGNPTVTDCTFIGNSGYIGGAMCNDQGSNPTVTDCILSLIHI